MLYAHKNGDIKYSGDHKGVGVLITRETWEAVRSMDAPEGGKAKAMPLSKGDRIYVSRRQRDAANATIENGSLGQR